MCSEETFDVVHDNISTDAMIAENFVVVRIVPLPATHPMRIVVVGKSRLYEHNTRRKCYQQSLS